MGRARRPNIFGALPGTKCYSRHVNPANDAAASQLLDFAQNRVWSVHLLFVTYVIGFPALLAFAVGLSRVAAQLNPSAEMAASLGQCSVVVVAALFGLVNVAQVTLVAANGDLHTDPALTRTLWIMHNAIFTLNFVAVACALFELGRAAASSGIVPGWMGWLGLAGALALAGAALPHCG